MQSGWSFVSKDLQISSANAALWRHSESRSVMTPEWIKTHEAAAMMSISSRTLLRMRESGIVPPEHVKGLDQAYLFRRSWIINPTQWERYALISGARQGVHGIWRGWECSAARYLTITEAVDAAGSAEWWQVVDLLTNVVAAESR